MDKTDTVAFRKQYCLPPMAESKRERKVTQWCPTLCDPVDYTIHGILQARILEWATFPCSRGSSRPRDQTQVSRIAGGLFTSWATREAQEYWSAWPIPSPGDLPNPGIKPGFLHCRQILYQPLLDNWKIEGNACCLFIFPLKLVKTSAPKWLTFLKRTLMFIQWLAELQFLNVGHRKS